MMLGAKLVSRLMVVSYALIQSVNGLNAASIPRDFYALYEKNGGKRDKNGHFQIADSFKELPKWVEMAMSQTVSKFPNGYCIEFARDVVKLKMKNNCYIMERTEEEKKSGRVMANPIEKFLYYGAGHTEQIRLAKMLTKVLALYKRSKFGRRRFVEVVDDLKTDAEYRECNKLYEEITNNGYGLLEIPRYLKHDYTKWRYRTFVGEECVEQTPDTKRAGVLIEGMLCDMRANIKNMIKYLRADEYMKKENRSALQPKHNQSKGKIEKAFMSKRRKMEKRKIAKQRKIAEQERLAREKKWEKERATRPMSDQDRSGLVLQQAYARLAAEEEHKKSVAAKKPAIISTPVKKSAVTSRKMRKKGAPPPPPPTTVRKMSKKVVPPPPPAGKKGVHVPPPPPPADGRRRSTSTKA